MTEESAKQALGIEVAWCTENKSDKGGYCQDGQQSGDSSGKAVNHWGRLSVTYETSEKCSSCEGHEGGATQDRRRHVAGVDHRAECVECTYKPGYALTGEPRVPQVTERKDGGARKNSVTEQFYLCPHETQIVTTQRD